MGLLLGIELQNFRCFRRTEKFKFSESTYLFGINNSGKSAILGAIKFFFDDEAFTDSSYLNRTEFLAKGIGSNKSKIGIEFDLNAVKTKTLRDKLIKEHGTTVSITKIASFSSSTGKISFDYEISDKKGSRKGTPSDDLSKVIGGVKLTYLHPQEGRELLARAQLKLRQRLLANWGRRSSNVTLSLKTLQKNWESLGIKAKKYLSYALTQSIQGMWPGSEVLIELPRNIKDVLSVSEIKFKGFPGAPEIELTSQGTGAQSTILYLAHFILDSDRSLHRGEYHPVWLLEEPESFLHADLALKFAKELNSDPWLQNIQMIISTHSPLILATSRLGKEKIRWNLLQNQRLDKSKLVDEWSEKEIQNIGKIMGDVNFYSYFLASTKEPLVFIEDTKEITATRYQEAGVAITRRLRGITEVSRYIEVYSDIEILDQPAYFIVDADRGRDEISRFIENKKVIKEVYGFKKYKIATNIFVITLPEGESCENLFDEFENHLKECVNKLWDTKTWKSKNTVEERFATVFVQKVRGKKTQPNNLTDAALLIKNTQDVKDSFWALVEKKNYQMADLKIKSLRKLIR